MYQLLDSYQDVITDRLQGPVVVEPITLKTTCLYPISQRCYQVPEKLVQPVKDEIKQLTDQGIFASAPAHGTKLFQGHWMVLCPYLMQ